MWPTVACVVCGCSDFEKQSGYYICRNCDTQSQDIQEQSFEYGVDGPYVPDTEEKEEFISQRIDEEKTLTSWECFNIILRGLVDELIDLGARPRLRKVAFQLWACFLKNEQIVFFSKMENTMPSLPATFKNCDIEALYGIKRFRRMYLKELSTIRATKYKEATKFEEDADFKSEECEFGESSASRYSTRSLRRKQRKLAVSILEDDALESESEIGSLISDTETLETVGSSKNGRKVKIAFRKSAKKSMDDLMEQFKKVKQKYGNDIPARWRTWFTDSIYSRRKMTEPNKICLSINIIIVILRIALFLIQDPIQWADIFRWICEGRLSCFRVTKFLPENGFIRQSEMLPLTRANFIQIEMRRMTALLKIKNIPTPNLFVLVEEYAYELCLPNEFIEFVKKLMALFPPCMDFPYFENRVFPDYECRAMGYILFALKMLFSVDDTTELKQSLFADTVNKCNENEQLPEVPHLFSWTSWVRYIECRSAILCKYDVTMNQLYRNSVQTNDDVFLQHWIKTQPCPSNAVSNQKINESLVTQLEMCAKRWREKHVDVKTSVNINFPPTRTPFRTYTQYLISNHSELLSEQCFHILSRDFSCSSIKYLLDHEWAISIGSKFYLQVEPIFDTAFETRKKYKEEESNVPQLGRGRIIPAHVPTSVNILEDRKKKGKEQTNTLEEFHPEFQLFDLAKVKSEKSESFEMYYPSKNYWFLHDMTNRSHNENFNKLAVNHFSVSFLWLLKECSGMLRCELKDLYGELRFIEFAYACLFADDDEYSAKAPGGVYANEW